MIILTDAEYKRRIEEARQQGWKERCEVSERDEFRESLRRAIRESRQDFDRQIRMLTDAMVKAGMEDPFAPPKRDGPCTVGTAADGSPIVHTPAGVPGY